MPGMYAIAQPIQATPSKHGLVASAFPATGPDRWELGYTTCPENCVEVSTWDPDCALWPDGEPPAKSEAAANQDCYDVDPFVIESPFECSSTGFSTQDYAGRARRQLEAASSKALEFELWTGTLKGATNPSLVTGATVVGGGVAYSPARALSLLSQSLSNCAHGGRGMIHAPTFIADGLMDTSMIEKDGQRLVTVVRGDVLVAGDGYPGTGPGGVEPSAGTAWMYATGPVQYRLGDVVVYPETISEAMLRSRNIVEYRAERFAAANFDPCCHFAVLVDLTAIGGDGGGGGEPAGGYSTVAVADDTAVDVSTLFGWSLQNTFAGLSTVYIRFGTDATATPYIAINLAENETVTQIFEDGIPGGADGFFITVETGTVDGILYTS